MNLLQVGIADLKVTSDTSAVIVTYALGSCIGVALWDPVRVVGGMLHYMLPEAPERRDKPPERAPQPERPAMFADIGIPLLFKSMYSLGSKKSDLVVKVAGGGAFYDDGGIFNIGKVNTVMMRKLFWKNNVMIAAEDLGGSKSRTMRLYMTSGRCTITSSGEEVDL